MTRKREWKISIDASTPLIRSVAPALTLFYVLTFIHQGVQIEIIASPPSHFESLATDPAMSRFACVWPLQGMKHSGLSCSPAYRLHHRNPSTGDASRREKFDTGR